MKFSSSVCLLALSSALFAPLGATAARSFGEITVNKVNNVVESFDVGFAAATDQSMNTLIFAYGATNGGDTTNGWEHVQIVSYVLPDDTTKHVVAPDGCGSEFFHARFFLASGTAVPYDTRYEGYTKSGTSYINTDFMPNQDTRVVADITVNGLDYWFGCWVGGYGTQAYAIRWENSTKVYAGYNGYRPIQSDVTISKGKRYILDFNKNTLSMTATDGTLGFPTNTVGTQTFSTKPYPLYLFAFNEGGTYSSGGSATFHGCKIYDNGTLVRDYIPVSKGGVAYMFDVANYVLYPFLGSTPTAGAVVENDPLAKGAGPVYAASNGLEFEDIRSFTVVRWDPEATGTGDGKSWANAYTDLNAAIARAGVYKGEVWIKGGTYTPTKSMILLKKVAVMGGFDGGTYASEDAERAARDPVGNPTVFVASSTTQVDLDKTTDVDTTAIVDGVQFRNTSGWLIQSSTTGSAMAHPLFTNCTFAGAAIRLQRSAAKFANCRFENLRGGSYDRIFIEYPENRVDFSDCTFYAITNNGIRSIAGYAAGASGRFSKCRFVDCVGNADYPMSVRNQSGLVEAFDRCTFQNCSTAGGGLVSSMAMKDCRFEGCRSTGASLFNAAGRTERTTFVNNIVHVDAPSVTSGTNYVDVLNASSQRTTFVNCTFVGNVVEANYGEGATVVRSTVRWSTSSSMGGALNCTFKDNAVDHDLVACGIVNNNQDYVNGYDVQLVNVVTSNPDANYRALRTFNCKTGGFCVYSSYLQGFLADQSYAFIQLSDDIRTDDARCSNTVIDDGVHRAIPLYSPASAKKRCGRLVQVGANGTYRFKNAKGTYIYSFNSTAAPTEPIVTIGDIFGAERPDDRLVPGSCQSMVKSGLLLLVR